MKNLHLERLHAGELPAEEAARLRSDPAVAARLQALQADDAALFTRLPPGRFAHNVARRAGRGRRAALVVGAPVLALAAGLALTLLPGPTPSADPDPRPIAAVEDGVRTKGAGPSLRLDRRTASGSEPLEAGDLARAGDVLSIRVLGAGRTYGLVFSADGAGALTLHFPATEDGVGELAPTGATLLPVAYALDEAPRFERFFLVTAPEPIDVSAILDAARRAGAALESAALALPPGHEQSSLLLRKAP